MRVCAQVDAADERALLADLGKVLFLGRGLQQCHGVVAEDTGKDLEMGVRLGCIMENC